MALQARRDTLANATIQSKVGKSGNSPGDFKGPRGLAIEPHSQNIYVADMLNGRIQVFSPSLQFLFQFPSERGVALSYPWGVCLLGYLVFVTETASIYFMDTAKHGVSIYTLDGALVSRSIRSAIRSEEARLYIPRGIAVDEERNAFIADYKNDRVVVYTTGLPAVALVKGNIKHPIDVKVHRESLFVLSETGLLLKIRLHSYQAETLVERGKLGEHCTPKFFQIEAGRIYITDYSSFEINELSMEGDVICKTSDLNLRYVAGIGFNSSSQIVVICEKDIGRLNILS